MTHGYSQSDELAARFPLTAIRAQTAFLKAAFSRKVYRPAVHGPAFVVLVHERRMRDLKMSRASAERQPESHPVTDEPTTVTDGGESKWGGPLQ